MPYDLNIFDSSSPGFATGGGTLVDGNSKIAQKFIVRLLTERGSYYQDETLGTDFLYTLRSGNVKSEFVASSAISVGLLNTKNQLLVTYDDSTPDNEKLAAANLVYFLLDYDKLMVYVTLQVADGKRFAASIPVTKEALGN